MLQWKDTPAEQLMESKLKCVFDVDPEMLQVRCINVSVVLLQFPVILGLRLHFRNC